MMNKHLFVLEPDMALAMQTALRTVIEDPSEVVKWMMDHGNMHLIAAMSRGKSRVVPIDNVIDFDGSEMQPLPEWEVMDRKFQLPNRAKGKFDFDIGRLKLFDEESALGWRRPKDGIPRAGADYSVRRAMIYLSCHNVPRSQIVTFLLDHSYLIPTEWQQFDVVIGGTRYRHIDQEFLLALHHDGKSWDWGPIHLDDWVNGKMRFLVMSS